MSRWQYTDPDSILQQRAEYTLERVAEALRLALAGAESDLELQTRVLVGMAGDLGQDLLVAAADRGLRSCQWPQMRPRPPRASPLRELLAAVTDGELTIAMLMLRPGVLRIVLRRQVAYADSESLRGIEMEMDTQLWEQIRGDT